MRRGERVGLEGGLGLGLRRGLPLPLPLGSEDLTHSLPGYYPVIRAAS
jgi:hypothetical protein